MQKKLLAVIISLALMLFIAIPVDSIAQKKLVTGKRPNVIMIYSDDQGSLDLNIYGAKDLATPNLDKLARNGVRFSNFYSASPVCSPSRASLLTGRYPQRAGLVDNASGSYGGGGMPGAQFTMAELFKGGGYKTAHIGKWHVGYSPETMPNAQGFDYSFGFMGGCIDNYSHFFYWSGPNRHDLWKNGKEIYRPGKFFADMMVEEAGTFMKENKEEPFFMYWAINIPHYPIQPDLKWQEHYKDLPQPRRGYAAFVSMMDEKIGQLLKKVDELGLTDNTIIVFQADQGHSEEERAFGGGGYTGAYRGAKFSLFEGGIHVPAIISWPGHIARNVVRNQFAANIDWYPTLAEYCRITLPERTLDGRSLAKIIASDEAVTEHPIFHWQSLGTKELPQWSVRDGDWKLIHNPIQSTPADLDSNRFMLINIKKDKSEKTNEAANNPAIVARLQQLHNAWLKQVFED